MPPTDRTLEEVEARLELIEARAEDVESHLRGHLMRAEVRLRQLSADRELDRIQLRDALERLADLESTAAANARAVVALRRQLDRLTGA